MSKVYCFTAGLLFCFAATLPSAARPKEPPTAPALYNILSEEEEVAFGRASAAQVERQMPMLDDPLLTAYVDSVGQQLAKKSRRPNLSYHFRIVDSPVVNAFALPGGYIYVHRGLLDLVQSESELAGVLAHEISHVAAYHGANAISRRLIAEHLLGEGARLAGLNQQDVAQTLESLGGAVPLFVERPLNQEDELEADRLGVYNAARAGWNPEGMLTVLERIQKFSGEPELLSLFTSTHPPPQVRIDAVRRELREMQPAQDLATDSLLFQAAKARMLLLPPPKGKDKGE